ncbi:peptidyl-tRNA hydrolase, PTH1 family (plasmid) [Legionella adelaidensis]|uniref:Peptidyl-tRNA hydrolase n=1 Tax=Legionella adelaidensis TaxID=45056 RepID=A0A0W0R3L8_9GAMM|nr:aminoacyl-tRNA hydrolase [Legionella adelaidensis]KTC65634.1 peptidyl-tRNA hydrolase [Legionella adelaidensis]VEH85169.1 peptidyl-tRNA hydrolase, PTH1 family [Legionella adelaidensis]
MSIKLIVGLRNPGSAYEHTRHNVGGWFAELLASQHNASFKTDKKLNAELTSIQIEHHLCRIILPLTFMNHSGLPIRAVCQFYSIEADEVLVVHDDLDLPAGKIKLKSGGGHGGHNGLRNTIAHLGSAHFNRLRIGIGHPGHKDLVLNYVLGKPSVEDKKLIMDAIDRAVKEIPTLFSKGMSVAMNRLNT